MKKLLFFIFLFAFFACNGEKAETERSDIKVIPLNEEQQVIVDDVKKDNDKEEKQQSRPQWPPAPDFTVTTLDGESLTLSKLKGKVVLVDFWATWCAPCVWEIPFFCELYEKYKDEGFYIIGLTVDRDRSAVGKFVRENKIPYPIAWANEEILRNYGGINAIPTNFLIGRDGLVREVFVGAKDKLTWEEVIKKFL